MLGVLDTGYRFVSIVIVGVVDEVGVTKDVTDNAIG